MRGGFSTQRNAQAVANIQRKFCHMAQKHECRDLVIVIVVVCVTAWWALSAYEHQDGGPETNGGAVDRG